MAKRFVGQADLIESNKASMGQITGAQLGPAAPAGVVDSLQERPSASATSTLYYEEALGGFTQPSFQRTFGTRNSQIENIDRWNSNGASSGTFFIDQDIFWNGPAMVNMKVEIPWRWYGSCQDVLTPDYPQAQRGHFMRPQFFYSWGAGFAAVKQWRMNLGGAGQYTIDRYSNFIAIMASCYSTVQRMGLMKLSGGGVIAETYGVESSFGLSGSTATYGSISCYGLAIGQRGSPQNDLTPTQTRVPVEDNWIIPIKTPHTNYNNCRIRRRPLDTKLFSQPFCIDFWLASFDEVCDSSTGFAPIGLTNAATRIALLNVLPRGRFYIEVDSVCSLPVFYPEVHRQYELIGGVAPYPGDNAQADYARSVFSDATSQITFLDRTPIGAYNLLPTTDEVTATTGKSLLSSESLPRLSISSVISSLRLTNDMLGAYDVLKTRTDTCVYYPFQHFSTQIYSVSNTLYGGMSLDGYVNKASASLFPSTESTQTLISLPVNIPVNPMTAMYIGVAREKDRRTLGISTKGAYSPCLFWNFLTLPRLEITYGSNPLMKYSCLSEYLSEQLYEHCSPIQIPYKGGFCLRSEIESAMAGGAHRDGGGGLYHGVMRNAYIYELSLVEMEPLRNEAFFQQTPSFLGEQINVGFSILPSTTASGSGGNSSVINDYSLIDNYKENPTEIGCTMSANTDLTGSILRPDLLTVGIPNTEKGGGSGKKVDVWHLNNDTNLMVVVIYAQNALWQLNPNASKLIFARG